MVTEAICRNCSYSETLDVAPNEQDLLTVGMLERHCPGCGRDTRWGRAHDYRRKDRRSSDRRHQQLKPDVERRTGPQRSVERRKHYF